MQTVYRLKLNSLDPTKTAVFADGAREVKFPSRSDMTSKMVCKGIICDLLLTNPLPIETKFRTDNPSRVDDAPRGERGMGSIHTPTPYDTKKILHGDQSM